MNTRFHSFDIVRDRERELVPSIYYCMCVYVQVVTAAQVVEATKAVLHTILLHRSTGKVNISLYVSLYTIYIPLYIIYSTHIVPSLRVRSPWGQWVWWTATVPLWSSHIYARQERIWITGSRGRYMGLPLRYANKGRGQGPGRWVWFINMSLLYMYR